MNNREVFKVISLRVTKEFFKSTIWEISHAFATLNILTVEGCYETGHLNICLTMSLAVCIFENT